MRNRDISLIVIGLFSGAMIGGIIGNILALLLLLILILFILDGQKNYKKWTYQN